MRRTRKTPCVRVNWRRLVSCMRVGRRPMMPSGSIGPLTGMRNVVAEVAVALRISRGRAMARLRYAIALRERLPRVAEVFARGAIDFRLMAAVVYRTELIEDPVLIAKLDAAVARHAPRWMRLSAPKAAERIDMWVARFDPAGVRVPGNRNDDRYVEISPTNPGLAGVWAQLHAIDGAALERKLDALAATVCRDDPRTKAQRRADAPGRNDRWVGRPALRMRCAGLSGGTTAAEHECGDPRAGRTVRDERRFASSRVPAQVRPSAVDTVA